MFVNLGLSLIPVCCFCIHPVYSALDDSLFYSRIFYDRPIERIQTRSRNAFYTLLNKPTANEITKEFKFCHIHLNILCRFPVRARRQKRNERHMSTATKALHMA